MGGFEFGASESLMNPLTLFLQADIVVKLVMIGLLLASIWTWAIIISHGRKIGGMRKKSERFERDFWRAEDIDRFFDARGGDDNSAAKVFSAGLAEWRRSTKNGTIDRPGTRQRLATAMGAAVASEMDKLSDRLNILATVGAVAPFVGLFGTVWGIMGSFQSIAQSSDTSLAVVAPGIAEALFATAMGLLAAIPAVVAYNKFSGDMTRFALRLEGFVDEFNAILSRQIESAR